MDVKPGTDMMKYMFETEHLRVRQFEAGDAEELFNAAEEAEVEKKLDVEFADLSAMLRESDYFALLLPLNESTRGIMGEHEFSLMKTGCVFVNSARAGIVDERAFMNAMRDGTIGYAALDVQWEEPLSHGPLLEMNNIVFAPHLGGSTYECDKILVQGVLEALGVE